MNVPQLPTDRVDPADERDLPSLADLDALVVELDELDRRLAELDD